MNCLEFYFQWIFFILQILPLVILFNIFADFPHFLFSTLFYFLYCSFVFFSILIHKPDKFDILYIIMYSPTISLHHNLPIQGVTPQDELTIMDVKGWIVSALVRNAEIHITVYPNVKWHRVGLFSFGSSKVFHQLKNLKLHSST